MDVPQAFLPVLLLSLEIEIGRLSFLRRDSHLHFLRTVFFLPRFDRISPRRQALDGERAIVAGNSEERMAHYADVGAHPGMHIALYRYHDFLAREALLLGIALGRLRLVPLLVHLWQRMDVVIGRIVVDDFDLL